MAPLAAPRRPCYALCLVGKLVLLSVCLALAALPLWAARQPHPARGLRLALVSVLGAMAAYVVILRVVYPRLG